MASEIYLTFLSLVMIAIIASFFLWARFLYRWSTRRTSLEALVPAEPRERPSWTIADFFVAAGSFIIGFVLFSTLFAQQGWIENPTAADSANDTTRSLESLIASIAANSLASGFAVAMTLGWLSLSNPKAIEQLGIIPTRSGVLFGLRASLWILPPVSLIAGLVSLLVPYEHPVLNTLAESPTFMLFSGMFVGTAVVAPFVEEFMFRVLLQGGLERVADGPTSERTDHFITPLPAHPSLEVAEPTTELADAYRPPRELLTQSALDSENGGGACWAATHYWPIVLTSVLFASMHLGQGAAPIPLFVLSLALGYLYRQTGKITAPLIVHMVLNAVTLCVEFTRFLAE